MKRRMPVADLRTSFAQHVCQTSPEPLGIVVARAQGGTIWDRDGRAYLDLLAGMGVANIGHTHPHVVAAIEAQARQYLHCAVYGETVQRPQVELAARLAEITPGALATTFFANSGAEAIEGALKTARKATGRSRFVAFQGAFHGDTFGAMSIGGNPLYQRPFLPLLADVTMLPFDDIEALEQIDIRTAAVVVEPIQAEGGVRIPSDRFLPALQARCRAVGALLVLDEVLTGFGRTGRLFAAEHWGVEPDLLVLAKALGGGMPLGAFIGRPELMATLANDPPLAHVTTFGGHPLCCAAGLAALDVMLEADLPARAHHLGNAWLDELRPLVGGPLRAVRGRGLLLALEFAHPEATQRFTRFCFARGIILNWTLHRDTVVRMVPPLTIEWDEIARATAVFREALSSLC